MADGKFYSGWLPANRAAIVACGLLVWLLNAALFFRGSLRSGLDIVQGELGDGRLITFLHEHLYNWLRGTAEFRSPAFFHPQKLTLGYSDAFVLDILPYALFRALGADPSLSMLLLQIALSLLCFVSAAIVYLTYFRIHPLLAFPAAALVTFPNNLFVKASFGHVNFFGLYYLPMVILLGLWALENFPKPTPWAALRGFLAALLFALLFSTAYYVAWLFALTLLIAALCVAGQWAIDHQRDLAKPTFAFDGATIKPLMLPLAGAAAGFAAGLIPFAFIYMPVIAISPGRIFDHYLALAPVPVDVFNVSRWNFIWGRLIDSVIGDPGSSDPERALAVTPVMTLAFFGGAYLLLKRDSMTTAAPSWERLFAVASVGVFTLSWLLTLKIGETSAFRLLFDSIPGAVAIRAGGRIQLLVNIWIVSCLALALDHWLSANRASGKRLLLTCGLLAFCAVEQVNRHGSSLSRAKQRALVASIPPAPADCRSFFLDRPTVPVLIQFEALAIAQAIGLPTLNGSSGVFPPGWQFGNYDANYIAFVKSWIAAHQLIGVCGYDQTAGRWTSIAP